MSINLNKLQEYLGMFYGLISIPTNVGSCISINLNKLQEYLGVFFGLVSIGNQPKRTCSKKKYIW